jgi:hypothetical protein
MTDRIVIPPSNAAPAAGDLLFRTPPNWPAVFLFAVMSLLHYANSALAFAHDRLEGYMSLIFGSLFATAAFAGYVSRFELAVLPAQRRLRLRSGYRYFTYERWIPFTRVRGVRLTTTSAPDNPRSRIELLCDLEDVECPPTCIPRQEALCLAMTLGVRLVKVSEGGEPTTTGRIEEFRS